MTLLAQICNNRSRTVAWSSSSYINVTFGWSSEIQATKSCWFDSKMCTLYILPTTFVSQTISNGVLIRETSCHFPTSQREALSKWSCNVLHALRFRSLPTQYRKRQIVRRETNVETNEQTRQNNSKITRMSSHHWTFFFCDKATFVWLVQHSLSCLKPIISSKHFLHPKLTNVHNEIRFQFS